MNKDEFYEKIDLILPQIITDKLCMIETIEEIRKFEEDKNINLNHNNIFGINVGDDIEFRIVISIPKTPLRIITKIPREKQGIKS